MSLIFFVRVRRGSDGWMATFWLSQHSGWRAEHGEQTVNEDYDQGLKRLWCTKNHAKYIYIYIHRYIIFKKLFLNMVSICENQDQFKPSTLLQNMHWMCFR